MRRYAPLCAVMRRYAPSAAAPGRSRQNPFNLF